MYVAKFKYSEYNIKILRLLGVLLTQDGVINVISGLVITLSFYNVLSGMGFFLIKYTSEHTIDLLEIDGTISFIMSTIFFMYFLLYFRKQTPNFHRLLELCEELQANAESDRTLILNDLLNVFTIICNVLGVFCTCIMIGFVLISKCDVDFPLCTYNAQYYLPYLDVTVNPQRVLTQMLVLFHAAFAMFASVNALVQLSISFVTISVHFIDLCDMIKGIALIDDREERAKRVKKVICFHHQLLDACDFLQGISSAFLLVQTSFSSLIVACLAHGLLYRFQIANTVHMSVYLLSILVFGFCGTFLIEQSDRVLDTCFYAVPWDGDVQTARCLFLVMERCKKPLTIDIWSFGYYRRSVIIKCMKTIYSILTFFSRTGNY